jgi:hypothetical protein
LLSKPGGASAQETVTAVKTTINGQMGNINELRAAARKKKTPKETNEQNMNHEAIN